MSRTLSQSGEGTTFCFCFSEWDSHAYHSVFLLTWKNCAGSFALVQLNCILAGNVLCIRIMKDDFICQTRQKISETEKKENKTKKSF